MHAFGYVRRRGGRGRLAARGHEPRGAGGAALGCLHLS